ncbi:BTB/POZ protein [Jimgerdemannia flammicorona]|uniref:BTB/POZ protein n=1 Tax=Jimgerdemannia flammicorona TaxID=994334 RepID=A0A433QIE6_9FUNG|nr:BTB/POZ protein [Jimgerdemannia flammicorona]
MYAYEFADEYARRRHEEISREQISRRVQPIQPPDDEIVHLNVGGKLFVTKRSSLLSVPNTFFHDLLASHIPLRLDGNFFIDRDPEPFKYILNYLRRGGHFVLPQDPVLRREIICEADFYRIPFSKPFIYSRCLLEFDPAVRDICRHHSGVWFASGTPSWSCCRSMILNSLGCTNEEKHQAGF